MSGRHMRAEVVRRTRHGESPFCWVQSNGEHIDDSRCQCLSHSPARCPVDRHLKDARVRPEVFNLVTKEIGKKLDHRGTDR